MPSLKFVTLDVFTTTRYKGNPLAICLIPPGQDVPVEDMQRIAREFNLSETVFLYEIDTETVKEKSTPKWKIRIFTTEAELPFAGHPTIGAACHALYSLSDRYGNQLRKGKLLCTAGTVEVSMFVEDGVATARVPHNLHLHRKEAFSLQEVANLQPKLKAEQIKNIHVVSPVLGMNFVLVELSNLQALAAVSTTGVKAQPKLDQDWDAGFTGSAFYVETGQTDGRRQLRTRMIEGNIEDPATGSMSCALAAYLAIKSKLQKADFQFTQAVEMDRRSDIGVQVTMNAELTRVATLELRGSSVKVSEGVIEY